MTLTAYELERQQRVEANRKRMEQLGLQQMAEDMAQANAADAPPRKKREKKEAGPPPEPTRRSSRQEGKERPNYAFDLERGSGSGERRPRDGPLVKEGECEEVYSVDHVRALGTYQKEWEMFQDGYNAEGERIYDSEKGASCHQCRQKTLGLRTCCSRCKSGLGMLCGDCLFARYGENVEEAVANKEWTCPCCRDLCNCSTHRKKRKWEATGALHRSVKSRGYLSVAHYLVLNKAGGLQAKRAALATGFCPPDLAEKLRAEIKVLEEEEAAAPPPPPAPPAPAAEQQAEEGKAAGEEGQQQEKKKRKSGAKRSRKSAADGGKEEGGQQKAGAAAKGKGKAAAGSGKEDGEGKKKAAGKRKAAAEAEGGGGGKKKGKGKQAAAAGQAQAGEAAGTAEAGGKKKRQRKQKNKGQAAEGEQAAGAPAAAAGVLEASGSGGAVAAAGSQDSSGRQAAAQAPAAAPKPAVVVTKAPFSFASRKRFGGGKRKSSAAVMEAAVAVGGV